nr:MAG TPA: hypothetical protein [Caudoviricetes sp.]
MSKHIRYFSVGEKYLHCLCVIFHRGSSLILSERLRHITLVDHDRSTRDL